LGKELDETGGITDVSNDNPPYIAIGGRALGARGEYVYFWIYRGILAQEEEKKETLQYTPAYQTPNLTGEALPRLHDGLEKYKIWENSPKVTNKEIFNEWFTKVIDKNWVPEV